MEPVKFLGRQQDRWFYEEDETACSSQGVQSHDQLVSHQWADLSAEQATPDFRMSLTCSWQSQTGDAVFPDTQASQDWETSGETAWSSQTNCRKCPPTPAQGMQHLLQSPAVLRRCCSQSASHLSDSARTQPCTQQSGPGDIPTGPLIGPASQSRPKEELTSPSKHFRPFPGQSSPVLGGPARDEQAVGLRQEPPNPPPLRHDTLDTHGRKWTYGSLADAAKAHQDSSAYHPLTGETSQRKGSSAKAARPHPHGDDVSFGSVR